MADLDPEHLVLVTPKTLQSGILQVANSLRVWTATLPFPGWISIPGESHREEVSYPTVNLFAYTHPKYKKTTIYFDPTFYRPSNDRGFEDLKIKLLSTYHANGSCMTYQGSRLKMDTATSPLPTPKIDQEKQDTAQI
jgi:hypothetical protein